MIATEKVNCALVKYFGGQTELLSARSNIFEFEFVTCADWMIWFWAGTIFVCSSGVPINSGIIFNITFVKTAKFHKIVSDKYAFFQVKNVYCLIGLVTTKIFSKAVNSKWNIEVITKKTYTVYIPSRTFYHLYFYTAWSMKPKPFDKPNLKYQS